MFNPLKIISKLIKGGNQKELDKTKKIIDKINSLEKDIEKLENSEFPKKTGNLVEQLSNGKTTKDILKTQQHCNHTSLNTTHIYLSKLTTNNIDYYAKLESELA